MANAAPIQVPCCPGGFLKADDTTDDFYCAKCRKVYGTAELLALLVREAKANRPVLVPLHGSTYPVKDELKKLGARWNQTDRVWMIPEARLPEAQRIVRRGPVIDPENPVQWDRTSPTATRTEPRFHPERRACWECGALFTEPDPVMAALGGTPGGVWAQYWCGCTDAKKALKKPAPPPVTDDDADWAIPF